MKKVEVPSRVVFVNIKDGNAFFDCTPAEARLASKLIKEMRDKGESNLDYMVEFKSEVDEVVNRAVSSHIYGEWTVGAMSVLIISDAFRAMELQDKRVTHVVMNAHEYACIRLLDRDCVDMVTEAWKLRAGVMALMWGAYIVVSKDMPKGEFAVCTTPEYQDSVVRISLKYDKNSDYGVAKKASELDSINTKLDRLIEKLDIKD